jgi:hypothetical protein
MYYQNEKLNEIFRDTWPNLGWAKRMNEPIHAKVSEEDYQKVLELMSDDLVFKTDGEEKFRIPFSTPYVGTKCPEIKLEVMTHEEMLEEAAKREAERKALDAVDKLYKNNGDDLKQLAEIEKEEWERKERSDTVLRRYNAFYNDECSGLTHGTPITPEHMQAMTLECMVDALICENLNVEYNVIAIDDIKDLIEGLYQQSNEYLERVRNLKNE